VGERDLFFRRIEMARGDQSGRQWKIIQTLISSRKGKSAAELAEEMESSQVIAEFNLISPCDLLCIFHFGNVSIGCDIVFQ